MPNIFVDPYVFACPKPAEGLEQFKNYIESIISWRDFREAGWASIYITARTPEILAQTNSYPIWNDLKNAITRLGVVEIQAKDVVDLVNSLLQKLRTIEETFLIEEVLIDDVICRPSYHLAKRPPMFIEHYYRLVILICLAIHFHQLRSENQALISRRLDEDRTFVESSAIIQDCECSFSSSAIEYPFFVTGRFPLCNTPHGLYISVNPLEIWAGATRVEDFRMAVNLFVYQRGYSSGVTISMDELKWSFNSSFLQTGRRLGFMHEQNKMDSLLKACAETIMGENLRATHAIRMGSGPEEPQKTRGKDKAWRRNIDYEYHLHYWETSDGPEFASVVSHHDMGIPE